MTSSAKKSTEQDARVDGWARTLAGAPESVANDCSSRAFAGDVADVIVYARRPENL